MEETTGIGRTIEEAIEQGLRSLGAQRDEVEVEPLDTGRRGFLGIFGRRNARVRVLIRQDDRIRTRILMRNILRHLGVEIMPDVQEDRDEIIVSLGDDASVLIGHHGQTLDALQYLASRIINNDREKWKKIVIDINNYRDKREDNLHSLSEQLANQAIAEGRDQRTDPLSAPERRIIHMALRDHPKVTTFSVGEGSYRRVIVALREGIAERRDRPGRESRPPRESQRGRDRREGGSGNSGGGRGGGGGGGRGGGGRNDGGG
ncbi:MAG TPA: RNA-binding cell elongation regulator Jag/EloR, partial [bacterium]|nr:RNA-binding cell elongation regulator Jag/EloR [bacterium]